MAQTKNRQTNHVWLAALGIFGMSFLVNPAWSDDSKSSDDDEAASSLKVLLVTSGCCHDYDFQTKQLQLAFQKESVDVVWTVVNDGGKGTSAILKLYDDPDWAKPYDVVIHNECFAKTTDAAYIRSITDSHKAGTPAVVIHCAMHTYRDAEIDDWRQMLGVTSRRHEHQSRYPVKVLEADHPVMREFPATWVTPMDELYIIEKQWPKMVPLAESVSEKTGESHPVFWTNLFGSSRVFGTTYGHSNDTFDDGVFLSTVVRGTLWATGQLK